MNVTAPGPFIPIDRREAALKAAAADEHVPGIAFRFVDPATEA